MVGTGEYLKLKPGTKVVSVRESVEFSENIRRAIENGSLWINLDLSGTTEISGSFAGFLAGIISRLHNMGGDLMITGANPSIQEVLKLVGFFDVIKVRV